MAAVAAAAAAIAGVVDCVDYSETGVAAAASASLRRRPAAVDAVDADADAEADDDRSNALRLEASDCGSTGALVLLVGSRAGRRPPPSPTSDPVAARDRPSPICSSCSYPCRPAC